MAYLTLFLGHITNMALMREFLRFLVMGKCDDRSVVNVILNSVTSTSVNVRKLQLYIWLKHLCDKNFHFRVLQMWLATNSIFFTNVIYCCTFSCKSF